ncbi:hypothetical protein [Vibrio parahaemolyticus]|uniref:hypothetical protein n=1 Tax=Vibrio parahaemolyticus TaxID=670 RepID=UPI0004E6CAA0|nr:hypothetical protein [Vibrio parahaemolyticus]AWG83675.1 hypothetical protein Vp2S01_1335 [Vibrio parahaemolyticus]EGR1757692.1 hypothetical protein [Vibrio parahaemolyticus]ELB2094435.1 hypothetical protein [Vibrio parahaemolyticus]ELB2126746.1 hypothetical protein [Vibrio parahaemolyticus]KFE92932.1 hypothetical protein HB39_25305 [Vibrio parahaemolyticus]
MKNEILAICLGVLMVGCSSSPKPVDTRTDMEKLQAFDQKIHDAVVLTGEHCGVSYDDLTLKFYAQVSTRNNDEWLSILRAFDNNREEEALELINQLPCPE